VRRRRPNRLAAHTSPRDVFIAGAITIVAFLFQGVLWIRVAQVLLFAFLAVLAGKRIRWGYFLIMVSSITLFNLLTPVGRVIFEVGPWPITEGALRQGLLKGFAIVGLVFISLFAVRPDLRLPGAFGGVIARLFYHFERVLDTKKRVRAAALIESIDTILLDIYPPRTDSSDASPEVADPEREGGKALAGRNGSLPAERTDLIGYLVLGTTVIASIVLAILF
jgi:heptaprenyl diphosphate synthase